MAAQLYDELLFDNNTFADFNRPGAPMSIINSTDIASVMRISFTVGPEYSCSLRKIDMMKAVSGWELNNVAGLSCSYGTTVRSIAVQGLVCSPRVVVIQIRRHKSLEMPLIEHDDVIEKFSA